MTTPFPIAQTISGGPGRVGASARGSRLRTRQVILRAATIALLTSFALTALPDLAMANGYHCTFTRACIDRRPCFDSVLEIEVQILDGDGVALLLFSDVPDRLARIEQVGIWTSFITDDDLDRVEVLDLDPDGRATLVAAQRRAPPETISRTGICTANAQ